MKKQITLPQSNGKVIANTLMSRDNDQLIIMFTDDTFLVISINVDRYEDIHELQDDEYDITYFNPSDLLKIGMFTEEDIRNEERKKQEAQKRREELLIQREKELFLRLAKKYQQPL